MNALLTGLQYCQLLCGSSPCIINNNYQSCEQKNSLWTMKKESIFLPTTSNSILKENCVCNKVRLRLLASMLIAPHVTWTLSALHLS